MSLTPFSFYPFKKGPTGFLYGLIKDHAWLCVCRFGILVKPQDSTRLSFCYTAQGGKIAKLCQDYVERSDGSSIIKSFKHVLM